MFNSLLQSVYTVIPADFVDESFGYTDSSEEWDMFHKPALLNVFLLLLNLEYTVEPRYNRQPRGH